MNLYFTDTSLPIHGFTVMTHFPTQHTNYIKGCLFGSKWFVNPESISDDYFDYKPHIISFIYSSNRIIELDIYIHKLCLDFLKKFRVIYKFWFKNTKEYSFIKGTNELLSMTSYFNETAEKYMVYVIIKDRKSEIYLKWLLEVNTELTDFTANTNIKNNIS